MGSRMRFYYRQFFVHPPELPKTLSLDSQTGIVTGSNVGLGLEACRHLLVHDLSHLILAVRSLEKGNAARTELLKSNSQAKIEVWELDYSSYDSIVTFVERCKTLSRIDFVILNAGVVKHDFERNASTGNEMTIQTNYLSTALLSLLLLPALESKGNASPLPHLTIIGSETGEWAAFKERKAKSIINAFNDAKNFNSIERYYTSKLLLTYFFREFISTIGATRVIINIVNPGFCRGSGLHREVPSLKGYAIGGFKRAVGRTAIVGGSALVDGAVVKGKESHGRYLQDCKVVEFWGLFESPDAGPLQKRLWEDMRQQFGNVRSLDLKRYERSI